MDRENVLQQFCNKHLEQELLLTLRNKFDLDDHAANEVYEKIILLKETCFNCYYASQLRKIKDKRAELDAQESAIQTKLSGGMIEDEDTSE